MKTRKIIVRMMGGLGNQMFQYAFALYVKKIYGGEIQLDIRGYKNYKVRNFELLQLGVENVEIYSEDKNKIYDFTFPLFRVFQFVYAKIKKDTCIVLFKSLSKFGLFYSTITFTELPILKKNDSNIYIWGYYQDASFCIPILEELREQFILRETRSEKYLQYEKAIEKSSVSVGISVRCGEDYINQGWPVLNVSYYSTALKKLSEDLSIDIDQMNIFVFADDILKTKVFLRGMENVEFIEGMNPTESFFLLKSCNHFIISNSTFAWWGSFLGEDINKKVVMPDVWFPRSSNNKIELLRYDNCIILEDAEIL